MGDVAMTVPVLRAFAKQYPDVQVTMVSRPFLKPLFDGIPNLTFFAVDLDGRHKGFFGLIRLFNDLRFADALADLHQVLRSKVLLTFFNMSDRKTASLDKMRSDKNELTRAENKVFKPLPHVTRKYAEVFEKLGFPIDLTQAETLSPKRRLGSILDFTANRNHPWIGIAPLAAHPGKVYPQDLMQQVIDGLAKTDATLFLFGGKSEIAQLEAFAQNHNNIKIVAGKLSFEQELALISNLDVILAMDSGNAHLAAIHGVPTITLWGATHPFTGFSPFGQPLENCITANREKYPLLPTSIYGNKVVPGYENAMRTIQPETVIAKVRQVSQVGN